MPVAQSLPRITARVDTNTQTLLARAAALAGVSSINSFVLNAAIEKAKQLIEQDQVLKLSEHDAARLAEALDAPAKLHPRLHEAAKRYQDMSSE